MAPKLSKKHAKVQQKTSSVRDKKVTKAKPSGKNKAKVIPATGGKLVNDIVDDKDVDNDDDGVVDYVYNDVELDDYLKNHLNEKPPVSLLHKFEKSAKIAMLLFAENSGYDYNNTSDILEKIHSSDDNAREEGKMVYMYLCS
jgi:hypothetical protein